MATKTILITIIITMLTSLIVISRNVTPRDQEEPTDELIAEGDPLSIAVWEWNFPPYTSDDVLADDLRFLNSQGVTAIYLNLNDVVDYMELTDNLEKDLKIQEIYLQLEKYISIANKNNIKIYGLFGNEEWSKSSHRYLTGLAVDVVNEYNAHASEDTRLEGIHFDIEPFSSTEFDNDPELVLQDFLDTYEGVVALLVENNKMSETHSPLVLGVDVPYWLDGSNGNVPQITRSGVKAYPSAHLMNLLSRYGNSQLVIMAYRNHATGENGTIELVIDELKYAQENALLVEIIVGQELNKEEPESISYYGQNLMTLLTNLELIETSLEIYPNYKGIALHELRSFKTMLNNQPAASGLN